MLNVMLFEMRAERNSCARNITLDWSIVELCYLFSFEQSSKYIVYVEAEFFVFVYILILVVIIGCNTVLYGWSYSRRPIAVLWSNIFALTVDFHCYNCCSLNFYNVCCIAAGLRKFGHSIPPLHILRLSFHQSHIVNLSTAFAVIRKTDGIGQTAF